MKLKQGDLVQIKPNLKEFDKNESPHINETMLKAAGELVTVLNVEMIDYKRIHVEENMFLWRPKWLNKIKKVKRKAEVGEFVLIIHAGTVPKFNNEPAYKNGDILKIMYNDICFGERFLAGNDGNGLEYILNNHEYVVLEGYEDCDQVKKFEEPEKVFEKGKTYIFDYETYRKDGGASDFCGWVEYCNGKVVTFNEGDKIGKIDGLIIERDWCIESNFNGKVVCVKAGGCLSKDAVVGKIYEFKDGKCKNELGSHFTSNPIESVEDLNRILSPCLEFIEVVE